MFNDTDDLLLKFFLLICSKLINSCQGTSILHSIGKDKTIKMIKLVLKGSSAYTLCNKTESFTLSIKTLD